MTDRKRSTLHPGATLRKLTQLKSGRSAATDQRAITSGYDLRTDNLAVENGMRFDTEESSTPALDAHLKKPALRVSLAATEWHSTEFFTENSPRTAYKVKFYDSLMPARKAWRALAAGNINYAFQGYDWMNCWLTETCQFNDIQPFPVLVETENKIPLLLLPLGIQKLGTTHCLVWLGGEFADYQTAVFSETVFELFTAHDFEKLWQLVCAILPDFDAAFLERQPAVVGKHRNPFLFSGSIDHACSAHSATLAASLTEFVDGKSGKKRQATERRKERRLSEFGELRFVMADSAEDIAEMHATLIRQKAECYKELGTANLLELPGYGAFVKRLTVATLDSGCTKLCGLYVGERLAATLWGLAHNKRFYYLLPAYERDELKCYSPGNLLLRHLFNWCIENGIETFDFTAGDEPYKMQWSDNTLALHDYLSARSARGLLFVWREKLKRTLKRRIKQTPHLYSAALNLRACLYRIQAQRA